jgi:hypothetical protein
MTPALLLRRVQAGIVAHLEHLLGLEPVPWPDVAMLAAHLATITAATAPGAGGELLTTSQLAQHYNVSPRTILRKKKRGELAPAAQLGRRGKSALRWTAP